MNRTVVAQGQGATYTSEGIRADGTTYTFSFTSNYDGADTPITGTGAPGGADSIAIKRVNSHKVTATLKKGGKEIGKSVSEVSKDGKVTTVTVDGKNPDGTEYHSVAVYDKQ